MLQRQNYKPTNLLKIGTYPGKFAPTIRMILLKQLSKFSKKVIKGLFWKDSIARYSKIKGRHYGNGIYYYHCCLQP